MKATRFSILCMAVLLLAPLVVRAEELSKYRSFSLGTSLTAVLKQTAQTGDEVKVLHEHPALIQELTWWPLAISGGISQPDPVQQILFSFYNGALYKISVTYDQNAVKGLTTADMEQAISAKYGLASKPAPDSKLPGNEQAYSSKAPVACWENSEILLCLTESSLPDDFGLVIFSKQLNGQAEAVIAEALKMEVQELPQKQAEQQKKDADGLETARQKNKKVFQP